MHVRCRAAQCATTIVALLLGWTLMVPGAAAATSAGLLTQLSGGAGCLKGTGGLPWIPCTGTVRGLYDVSSVALSPDGRFAYATSLYSGYTKTATGAKVNTPGGTLVAFSRNPGTGALTQLAGGPGCIKDVGAPSTPVTKPCTQTARGLRGANKVELSPDGRFVYVASIESDAIAAFSRNATTGALTQLPGAGACVKQALATYTNCAVSSIGLHGVRWITISPDGRNLYASAPASDDIVAFSRDTRTGALAPLPGASACIEDKLARVKKCPTTGVGLNYPRSLTVSPDGRNVYVASDHADRSWAGDAGDGDALSVFWRDETTGALHQLPGADSCIEDVHAPRTTACPRVGRGLYGAFEVVVSSDGRFAYLASAGGGNVGIFSRDPVTGALTQAADAGACLGAYGCTPVEGIKGADGITLSGDNSRVYVAGFDSRAIAVLSRVAGTGQLTPLSCVRDVSAGDTLARCPATVPGLNGPRKLTLSPDGTSAYVPASPGGTIAVFDVAPR